jgi:hypothetical protein
MKKFLAAAFAALAIATPAQAGGDPLLQASRYCQNMQIGMPWEEALAEAYAYSQPPKRPVFSGDSLSDQLIAGVNRYIDDTQNAKRDAKRVVLEIQRRCPQYLR